MFGSLPQYKTLVFRKDIKLMSMFSCKEKQMEALREGFLRAQSLNNLFLSKKDAYQVFLTNILHLLTDHTTKIKKKLTRYYKNGVKNWNK